jgi:YD repeat-containing protein
MRCPPHPPHPTSHRPLSLIAAIGSDGAADSAPRHRELADKLPRGGAPHGFRGGANHHLGDDSFVQKFGRPPRLTDDETLRARTHLEYAHARLSAKPATRPELAARRQQLLGYLADYIRKGTTPQNHHLAERTPVFIDDAGQICAVGYMIEQSAGRALPEKITRMHRFDFIEDIAKEMPEVREWVEASGLSLDEIASIQPGYMGPEIDQWQRWKLREQENGPYEEEESGYTVAGRFRLQQMHGAWTKTTEDGKVIGSGKLAMGSGKWRSNYRSGTRMAEGLFAGSHPTGTWRFYHPSGNLAAEGQLEGHARKGAWRFYYDTPAKTMFAKGDFASQTGWSFYDEAGQLLSSSAKAAPARWGREGSGRLTAITTDKDGIRRAVHSGGFPSGKAAVDDFDGDGVPDRAWSSIRLEGLALGDDRLLFSSANGLDEEYREAPVMFDGDGNLVIRNEDGGWQAQDCHWSKARKAAARAMDLVTLDGLLYTRTVNAATEECGTAVPVGEARGKRLDALLAAHDGGRLRAPGFITNIRDNELDEPEASAPAEGTATGTPETAETEEEVRDLARMIADDAQWDHFDTRFIQVFRTLPGSRFAF